jgi:hypothetical protein
MAAGRGFEGRRAVGRIDEGAAVVREAPHDSIQGRVLLDQSPEAAVVLRGAAKVEAPGAEEERQVEQKAAPHEGADDDPSAPEGRLGAIRKLEHLGPILTGPRTG